MGAIFSGQAPPPTDPTVSLVRYTGGATGRKWFDVAHFSQLFQPAGARDVIATYQVTDWGASGTSPKISVTNSEWLVDRQIEIRGVAWQDPHYPGEPGKLLVQFTPSEYFPLVPGPAHYWILMVSPIDDAHPDYRYAVVSNPTRSALWILSSTPQISDEDYGYILTRLLSPEFGFTDTQLHYPNLVPTRHTRTK